MRTRSRPYRNKSRPYRDYGWSERDPGPPGTRPEYGTILSWCPQEARVLDLGCGDGSLGALLIDARKAVVHGVEIDPAGVEIARSRNVDAVVGSLDEPLEGIEDGAFDLVVVNVTLQMVYRPRLVLQEALRVGRRAAISFPNFGYWRNRRELLLKGRFPRFSLYGHRWYDTRHIHLFSLRDFRALLEELGGRVVDSVLLGSDSVRPSRLARLAPNLLAAVAILLVEPRAPS